MDALIEAVASHYARPALYERLLEALHAAGRTPEAMTRADLAPVDAFHVGGARATAELLAGLPLEPGTRVLDVGCGLGGACRHLAAVFGCSVTGVDLSADYCRAAARLTEHLGLAGQVTFVQADARALPFAAGVFDLVLSQHVQMNLPDKRGYVGELVRVLRPGGWLALYEVFAGPGGAPHYPVPWASDAAISFLVAPDAFRQVLEEAGLSVVRWEDVTGAGRAWVARVAARRPSAGPGLPLLMGERAGAMLAALQRNLAEGRITLIRAIAERPA